MNFSVKILLISLAVFAVDLSLHILHSEPCYRLAELADVDALLEHYENIEQASQDRQNLVVYPIEVRREVLQDNIGKKRFYVAVDDESQKVIGFIKFFKIGEDELLDILCNEVCCIGDSAQPVDQVLYVPKVNDLLNHSLGSAHNAFAPYIYHDNQVYFYYGGAYTVPEFRNKLVCSNLLAYGLNDCCNDFKNYEKSEIVLVYGQARSASGQKFMIKIFAECMNKIFNSLATVTGIYHYRFKAFKPELIFADGKIIVVPPIDLKNHDYGNVVLYQINQ